MANEIANINQANNEQGMHYINTVQLDTAEGRKTAANAINNAFSLADFEGVELDIVGVMTTPGVRKARNANQPDTMCQNTYLLDKEGNAYFSQSDGVARSINGIMAMHPEFPRDTENGESMKVCLIAKQLPNGNSLKTLKML